MNVFDTYGIKTDDLELAKTLVEDVLGQMEPHESSYIGEYYLRTVSNEENYVLQPNFCDGDWTEEDYQDCGILLYINESPMRDKIREEILSEKNDKIELIRRVIHTEDGWRREYRYIDKRDVLISERNQASFNYC
jgi:hypothetical protein